ncbi:hypothetical protein EJB05_13581, partial [Eragrostis curvula]
MSPAEHSSKGSRFSFDMDAATPVSCPSISAPRFLLLIVTVVLLPCVVTQPSAGNLCGTKAGGRYVCPDCSTSASASTHGASFEANLFRFQKAIEDMLVPNAGFLNATFAGGDAKDTVYGLATCLADAERADCVVCLAGAAADLPRTRCSCHRELVLWYEHCLVRFDNVSFFGAADTSPARRFAVPNPSNFSDQARLRAARTRLADRLVARAAEVDAATWSPGRFAFDDEVVDANVTLHGLAQCTQDLPAAECGRCLASHMSWLAGCCADMDGVRLNGPSCYLRFEFMGFAPGTPPSMAPLVEPSPPAAVPPGAQSYSRRKTKIYLDRFCSSACEIDVEDTELVRKMVIIGLWCIQMSPSDRPSMSRVIEMLEKSAAELQLPLHAS